LNDNRRGLRLRSAFGKCNRAVRSTQNRYEAHYGCAECRPAGRDRPEDVPRRERSDPSYIRHSDRTAVAFCAAIPSGSGAG